MKKVTIGPLEPVLPIREIQGMAVPGFLKPHQTLVGVRFSKSDREIRKVKKFFAEMVGAMSRKKNILNISTAGETLKDRRAHHGRAHDESLPVEIRKRVFVGLALSFNGIRRLTPTARSIPGGAFRRGLAARSKLLGDPPLGDGSVSTWEVGGPDNELDALFVVAGDDCECVAGKANDIIQASRSAGLRVIKTWKGNVRSDLPGHEHFGFDDGVSQPGIRGRASQKSDDFITVRHIAQSQVPETYLFGYPGQDLVWPGEFLLGQPGTSPDPVIPGPARSPKPEWMKNGSYLVFRCLEQDVGLFWRTMRDMAAALSKRQGFEGMDADRLAARLIGRWKSGAPVNRVPHHNNRALGKSTIANNHFQFDSRATKLKLTDGRVDNFPMSVADPAGIQCPWASHIRTVNTRDSASDMGGRESTYTRRILRVGVPFGLPLKDRFATQEQDNNFRKRGLLFLSIQASIEEQFEFISARWMNNPARPKMPGGHDIVVGQNAAPGENRERRCVIYGSDAQQAEIRTNAQWIIPTGGGYFFVPSIGAIRKVLSR